MATKDPYVSELDAGQTKEYGQEEKAQIPSDRAGVQTADGYGVDISKGELKRELQGRHMQMIAIGGAIGAGLFVGAGQGLSQGGPGALVICFSIIGVLALLMMQALAELAVMYPVNGAFYQYICRFVDPSWGFALAWDYAISWMFTLPFELTAASITIQYWNDTINAGVWIAVFLVVLSLVQVFGVRGYGEVEFVLSMIKVLACIGFIILGLCIDLGGVKSSPEGFIGGKYWRDPGAFRNGFTGFCAVFVNAAFAYSGIELTCLAAAEAANPRKEIPKASRQVFWRIAIFYILNLVVIGLIVPSNSPFLLGSSGANTKASPFVVAIQDAGIKGLPSVMNAVITISVLSVANSATYASSRTLQALAVEGMGPRLFAYIDKKGRPLPVILLQISFGFLAFINEATATFDTLFTWLLALGGLCVFFIYGSICWAHIRFRKAWVSKGHTLSELPFRAAFGTPGSYVGMFLSVICLMACFYNALYPPGGPYLVAESFFEQYLGAFVILVLYLGRKAWVLWKIPSQRPFLIAIEDMDIYKGMRETQYEISGEGLSPEARRQSVEVFMQQQEKEKAPLYKRVLFFLF